MDLKEVSKEQFFKGLLSENINVIPTTEDKDKTIWRVVSTRSIWGISYPGWKNPMAEHKYYRMG